MHCSLAATLIAAFGLASSAPTSNVVANYDNIPANTLVPALNVVPRPYDGLCYDAFSVANETLSTFITPHSTPNVLASAVTTRLAGQPTISTTTCSTPVKSFSVSSFYAGCVTVAENSVASVPLACTFVVTGTKQSSAQTVKQTFTYTPTSLIKPPQQQVKLNGFTGLTKLTITFPDAVENTADVLLIDDVATMLS